MTGTLNSEYQLLFFSITTLISSLLSDWIDMFQEIRNTAIDLL